MRSGNSGITIAEVELVIRRVAIDKPHLQETDEDWVVYLLAVKTMEPSSSTDAIGSQRVHLV